MALTEHYAKDLLRHLPSRITDLLKHRKYWDLTFLRVYLAHCDEVLFDDPKAGLVLAKVVPRLALLIPKKSPVEWRHHTSEAEKQLQQELVVKSYAVLGGAYRAAGRNAAADESYQIACQICESGGISRVVRANLYKRLSKLRSAQKRFSEALDLVDYAIEIYRGEDHDYHAEALLTKGYILFLAGRFSEAVPLFGKVLKLTKPRRGSSPLSKRTFFSAVHNLAATLLWSCRPTAVVEALPYVRSAQRFFARKPNCLMKHKLAWIEGRSDELLGSTRQAARRFLGASKGLMKLGAAFEAALVALDLSRIYLSDGQWAELEALAIETNRRFRELSSETEAIAALKLWMEGAKMRSLSRATIQSARDTIETHALQQQS